MFLGRLYIRQTSRKSAKNSRSWLVARGSTCRVTNHEPRVTNCVTRRNRSALLDVNLRADFLELLLDGRRLVLVHAFLDRLRRAFDEVLGFLQTQAGDL